MAGKPKQGDYAPHFEAYIGLAAEGDLKGQLLQQERDTIEVFAKLSDEQGEFRYAADKWSLKEVLGHMTDTERVMTYRLLRIARGDTTPLPGFDENLFVANTDFGRRTITELLEEFRAVRAATLALLGGVTAEELERSGTVSGNRITAHALAYVAAGHALHHLNIVRDRYLPGLA
ncbi:DinB family protein [Paenibacillus chartarius]|uniref:DinB family protein n=1 Tax=Paenibacillus chartarius TaxID=747481 RepID=A0ABV6DGG5_9BACL